MFKCGGGQRSRVPALAQQCTKLQPLVEASLTPELSVESLRLRSICKEHLKFLWFLIYGK